MAKMASEEELAELEKLSASYVPEQKGDLVGARISSQILTQEYAKADPIYARKTQNLLSSYPEYRTIKGDGNCGFRAIAFGYFEALVRMGDAAKIQAEVTRVKSLNNMLDATGQEAFMYEDWVEETLELLQKTASTPTKDVENLLLEAFNDLDKANALTQHFRMVTSAQLKLHPDEYAPFVPDLDVDNYCKNHVDPFYEEIEHVGVKAVVDSIMHPAGIAVGYLYLDRSVGTEATPYSFPVLDQGQKEVANAPTVRLLYRPGHYDLLYTKEDIDQLSRPSAASSQPGSLSGQASVEVRMVQGLPDVSLSEGVNFEGLPGFEPEVHTNPDGTSALPFPPSAFGDLAFSPSTPDEAEYGRSKPAVSVTDDWQMPTISDAEQGLVPDKASRRRKKSKPSQRRQRKPKERAPTKPPKPAKRQPKAKHQFRQEETGEGAREPLSWAPKTFGQAAYDEAALACTSLQNPKIADPKKHSPVVNKPAWYKATDFTPKQYHNGVVDDDSDE